MKEIVVATKNSGKLKEFEILLSGLGIKVFCLADFPHIEEPEEIGTTFMQNAVLKAAYYAVKVNKVCIADDSGISVASLNGAPGVYSARYAGIHGNDCANNELLLKNMQGVIDRSCKFVCALAVVSPQGVVIADATGECHGVLLEQAVGEHGFGYDPLFYSLDLHKTLAQADMQEKNTVSHRGKALKILAAKLSEKL